MSRRSTPADVVRRLRVTEDGCWEWTGPTDQKGYGLVGYHGRTRRVHRLFYEWMVGPIPEEMQLDHLCRNRACANPRHLECVPPAVNTLRPDSEAPAAINARKTHCKHGHPLEGANLFFHANGGRQCLECSRARSRARYARIRDAA